MRQNCRALKSPERHRGSLALAVLFSARFGREVRRKRLQSQRPATMVSLEPLRSAGGENGVEAGAIEIHQILEHAEAGVVH
jgi:hypothetical protein